MRIGDWAIGDWVICGRFSDLAIRASWQICDFSDGRFGDFIGNTRGIAGAIRDDMSQADELQARTKIFAVQAVKFCGTIEEHSETRRLKSQLAAAATSVGANYRAARRARSHAEFTAKIGLVAEEADESEYWLSLAIDLELGAPESASALREESVELMKIFGKSAGTARSHRPDR